MASVAFASRNPVSDFLPTGVQFNRGEVNNRVGPSENGGRGIVATPVRRTAVGVAVDAAELYRGRHDRLIARPSPSEYGDVTMTAGGELFDTTVWACGYARWTIHESLLGGRGDGPPPAFPRF